MITHLPTDAPNSGIILSHLLMIKNVLYVCYICNIIYTCKYMHKHLSVNEDLNLMMLRLLEIFLSI